MPFNEENMFAIMNSTSFRIEAIGLLATSAGCMETTLRTKHFDLEVLEMARDFESKAPGPRRRVINLLDRAIKKQVASSKVS